MKVFITGVAGFLGSHLADSLLADGHQVIGIDNLLGGEIGNVPKGAEFHQADCNDFETVRRLSQGAALVYHCAATAYEGLSVFSPHVVTQNVVSASVSVFSAAVANRVKRVVHCSSMSRYGNIGAPFKEDQLPVPCSPYGIGKLATESILRNLSDVHGFEYAIAVPHNIIGPRQKYDDPFRNVAAIMINLMLQGRQPYIYGNGQQERCFSNVWDCVYSLKEMGMRESAKGQVINIGPDHEKISILELARKIALELDFKLNPIFLADRPQEARVAHCSSEKARRLLDYKPSRTLDEVITAMITSIRESGPRPFRYHLNLEIQNELTPRTWGERLF